MRVWPAAGVLLLRILAAAVCADVAPAQQYAVQATYPAGTAPVGNGGQGTGSAAVGVPEYAFREQPNTATPTGTAAIPASDPALSNMGPLLIERLPPVDMSTPLWVDPATKYAQDFPGGLTLPDNDVLKQEESARQGLPPGMRRAGCFQSVTAGGSWLATGSGPDGLGMGASSVRAEFVLPSLLPESFVLISPLFGMYSFDNPGPYDVPDHVYDAAVGFGLRGRCTDRLSYQAKVTVGSYSDFDNDSSNQVRVRGYATGLWKWNSTVDLTFGMAYIDLEDWPVVPIGGFIVRPDDEQTWELTFPRMVYSRRLGMSGTCGCLTEYWGSLGLEMGGGRWTVQRRNDTTGDLTYSDWRVTLGLQQKTTGLCDLKFDVGYVFGRRLEYDDEYESYAPDDTVSLTLTGCF